MRAKNATTAQLRAAMEKINVKYNDNITFNRLEQVGRVIHFTLTVRNSAGPGGRRGHYKNRRVKAACWHVHGDFFTALIELCPETVIYSGRVGRVDKDGGNWQDWNAGSMIDPRPMSDMCDCGQVEKQRARETGDWIGLNDIKVRTIRQDHLTAECWGIQLYGPAHCETCEFKNTDECGGQSIRKRNFNAKGHNVPVDFEPEQGTN